MISRPTYTTLSYGYGMWSPFRDLSSAEDIGKAVIDRIEVWSGEYINAFRVYFSPLNDN